MKIIVDSLVLITM